VWRGAPTSGTGSPEREYDELPEREYDELPEH